MWILSSLCDSLQEQVVTTPGNAKALWDHLKDLSHDNKDNRAINLDNELHSIKIGTMTVNQYCTKIRSMADRLKNLGCDVSDKNLVMYTVNGLDSHFATLVDIIRHLETLSSFETTRTMLLLKESSFKDDTRTSSTFDGSSSSPTALVTSTSSTPKGSSSKSPTLPQLCNHFKKGTCRFGDRLLLLPMFHRTCPHTTPLLVQLPFTQAQSITHPSHTPGTPAGPTSPVLTAVVRSSAGSGDLYPVTKLSPLPTAFVTTSSSTWHQRLGHPGDDVLRSLSTRNFIS
nr:hybrid signal transduction histidine kinase M [Tanacetum cinerariifolium]